MKEMEDTINTLTNKLDKMQAELDESKCNQQVSAVQHQQAIDKMTVSTFSYLCKYHCKCIWIIQHEGVCQEINTA